MTPPPVSGLDKTERTARRVPAAWQRVAWTICCALVASRGMSADESRLALRLKPLLAEHKGKVAVLVQHLESGEVFSQNVDLPMPTASLIKFSVMIAAYRLADEGKIDLNKTLILREEDKVIGSGILTTHFSSGTSISLRDAIRLMIAFSDNTATNLVLDQIGLKTTAETMESLGFPNTKIHAKVFRGSTSIFPERSKQFGLGSTTAAEMVKLLEMLDKKQIASAAACEAMLGHLMACEDKDKLMRDLPTGTKFAHKTGSVNAVRTDAGILVTPAGRIAICVLTSENQDQRWTRENAAELMCGRIGKTVYEYFNPTATPGDPAEHGSLALGSSGPLVEALQRTLNKRLEPSPDLSVDGEFGPATRAAVVRFQTDRKLPATGEVGPETWKPLGPLQIDAEPVPDPAVINGEKLTRESLEDLAAPPLTTCKAWAIGDGKSGQLLWSKNERQKLPIASTTKIMTAYLVFKLAEEHPHVLDDDVTFTQRADNTGGSTSELRAGEKLPVRELLFGLLLPSGNDAAIALAEHFGRQFAANKPTDDKTDPLDSFVEEMNRSAQALGMTDTHYRNPHGLSEEDHVSTAIDLLRLAQAARQLPRFRDYTGTRQRGYRVSGAEGYERNVLWKNTNKLLGIEGYDGIKTGTTDAAGACLVSAGHRDGEERIVVVLGSANSDARYVDTRNLFRWVWSQAKK